MPIEAIALSSQNPLEEQQSTTLTQSTETAFADILAEAGEKATTSLAGLASEETANEAGASYASASTETLANLAEQETVSETQSASDTAEKSDETLEKPCIAQFMVMTGCDFTTASRALYQYENWQDYLTSDNSSIPDLSTAQQQLQAERESGERSMVDGSYGARKDYVKPDPPVVENPGQVLPLFQEESGRVAGLAFYDAQGTEKTTSSLTDRETIVSHTDGFHIGRVALDQFAQKATGDATATFENLDLTRLAEQFPSYQEWTAKFGLEASANGLEKLAEQTDVASESMESAEEREDTVSYATDDAISVSSEYAELTQRAQMSLLWNSLAS